MIKVIIITNNIPFQLVRSFRSVRDFHNFWDYSVSGSLLEAYPLFEGTPLMCDSQKEYVVKRHISHVQLHVITEGIEE